MSVSGVDRTLVSKIERVAANPSLEVLVKLATALKVSTQTLLSEESQIWKYLIKGQST